MSAAAEEYRIGPWTISRNWKGDTQPDTWEFVHEQYDGPGDGSREERDNRCGFGRTLEDVLRSIELLEDEPVAPMEDCTLRILRDGKEYSCTAHSISRGWYTAIADNIFVEEAKGFSGLLRVEVYAVTGPGAKPAAVKEGRVPA